MKARLRHIDDRLIWFGFFRLADHAAKFGISDVQGKIDIKTYRNLSSTPPPERKPGPASSVALPAGTYGRPEGFVPVFEGFRTLDDLWLTRLEDARPEGTLSIERLARPAHHIDADAVRALLAATELRASCRLSYQSMTSAESSDRTVCPHALVKASGRYHVRAFDFSRKKFIDFSLSRVLSSTPLAGEPAVPAALDEDWHTMIDVEFVPHPRLSATQRSTTAKEFGMRDGTKTVTVRRALLFYLLDEMRLLAGIRRLDERLADVPLWVRNARRIAAELESMESDS
ncbi:WYL domain-containing protein [Bradyrhizobium yuanmingense]|uniref:WYL domain-containing protein n=1 Tax=Bradyrhizobium yuanmingense TaxID=108015 RepID=UPI001CD3D4C3|nr:WYL domain-containing protein [Bradyrhizobium yuanmingense]MCA1529453.1 WYL domain-containing protein [Bradyrhizobium yuanmingense]